jgi:hypothetical protein
MWTSSLVRKGLPRGRELGPIEWFPRWVSIIDKTWRRQLPPACAGLLQAPSPHFPRCLGDRKQSTRKKAIGPQGANTIDVDVGRRHDPSLPTVLTTADIPCKFLDCNSTIPPVFLASLHLDAERGIDSRCFVLHCSACCSYHAGARERLSFLITPLRAPFRAPLHTFHSTSFTACQHAAAPGLRRHPRNAAHREGCPSRHGPRFKTPAFRLLGPWSRSDPNVGLPPLPRRVRFCRQRRRQCHVQTLAVANQEQVGQFRPRAGAAAAPSQPPVTRRCLQGRHVECHPVRPCGTDRESARERNASTPFPHSRRHISRKTAERHHTPPPTVPSTGIRQGPQFDDRRRPRLSSSTIS